MEGIVDSYSVDLDHINMACKEIKNLTLLCTYFSYEQPSNSQFKIGNSIWKVHKLSEQQIYIVCCDGIPIYYFTDNDLEILIINSNTLISIARSFTVDPMN